MHWRHLRYNRDVFCLQSAIRYRREVLHVPLLDYLKPAELMLIAAEVTVVVVLLGHRAVAAHVVVDPDLVEPTCIEKGTCVIRGFTSRLPGR